MTVENNKDSLVQFMDTSDWDNICDFTLNLKQALDYDGTLVHIDDIIARKALKWFMHQLNKKIYKRAYRHFGKRLQIVAVLEKSKEGRFHFHAAIEAPSHMVAIEFCSVAMKLWLEQDFGYDHGMARPNADRGWIGYMAKNRSKDGLEHYFDCIDLDTYFKKVVSV